MLSHHSESELYPARPSETRGGFVGLFAFGWPFSVSVATGGCVAGAVGVALSDLEVPWSSFLVLEPLDPSWFCESFPLFVSLPAALSVAEALRFFPEINAFLCLSFRLLRASALHC